VNNILDLGRYKRRCAILSAHNASHGDLLLGHAELQTEIQICILEELLKLNETPTPSELGTNKETQNPPT
jgi:hypothetical protein